MKNKSINIYTDGSSIGNPGPGAYALILQSQTYQKEYYQAYRYTTNNRMELLAVIIALEIIKKENYQNIIIFTDSKYVIDPINKYWLFNWVKTGFKKKM